MLRKIFNIFLVVMSMFTIFMFSSENAVKSTETSKTVAKEVVGIVVKDEKRVEKIVDKDFVIFRKIAHLTEFYLLGFLLVNIWADGKKSITLWYVLVAIFISLLYAGSDEYHQTMIPGRSGEVKDVVIDTTGSSLGAFSYYFMFRYFKRKKV